MKKRRSQFVGAGSVVLACLATEHLAAQTPSVILIPDGAACQSCRIVVSETTILRGGGRQGELTGVPSAVRRDKVGRYWVLQWQVPPLLFDRTGEFYRQLGRLGPGPEEFRNPTDVAFVPGDSIVVIDAGANRAMVFDAQLHQERSVGLPPTQILPHVAVLRWPDNMVMNTPQEGMRRELGPLLRLSMHGPRAELLASFGSEPGEVADPRSWVRRYLIAAAPMARHWSAEYAMYRLSLWSSSGGRLQVLERRVDWFPPPPTNAMGGPTLPPSARIQAIHQEADGLVWVFITVAAPTWREAWPPPRPGGAEARAGLVDQEKLYRTTIEVLDSRAARVVARTDLDR